MPSLTLKVVVRSAILSVFYAAPLICWVVVYKKIQISKVKLVVLVIGSGLAVEVMEFIHELGHIFAIQIFGYSGFTLVHQTAGYSVFIGDLVDLFSPQESVWIAFAGPLMSMFVSLALWLALRFCKPWQKISCLYLFSISVFGCASSLFLPLSGDAMLFARGLGALSGISWETVLSLNIFVFVGLAIFIGKRIYREFAVL